MTETGFGAIVRIGDSITLTLKKISFELQWEIEHDRFITYEESDLPYLVYAGKAKRRSRWDTAMVPTWFNHEIPGCNTIKTVLAEDSIYLFDTSRLSEFEDNLLTFGRGNTTLDEPRWIMNTGCGHPVFDGWRGGIPSLARAHYSS